MEPIAQPEGKPFSWGAIRAIAVTIAIYFLSQFGAVLVVYGYANLHHWSPHYISQWLQQSVAAEFAIITLVELSTVGLLYLFIRRYKTTLKDLGLLKPRLRDAAYALAGFAAYFPLYIFGLLVLHLLAPRVDINQKQQLGFENAGGRLLILVFIGLVVLAPIAEEILVRGFLYGTLKKHWPKLQAVLGTSLLFAVAHLQFGSGAPLLWGAALDTFILSLVLIYLRDKTGSLVASIMLHMLKNGLAFVALFILRAG